METHLKIVPAGKPAPQSGTTLITLSSPTKILSNQRPSVSGGSIGSNAITSTESSPFFQPNSTISIPVSKTEETTGTAANEGSITAAHNKGSIPLTGTEVWNLLISQGNQRSQPVIDQQALNSPKQTDPLSNAYSCVEHEISITDQLQSRTEKDEESDRPSCMQVDDDCPQPIHEENIDIGEPSQTIDESNDAIQYYTSLSSSDLQSLQNNPCLEVTTFVTEDGQTGQILISDNNSYSDASTGGIVTLGDTNISTLTSMNGQLVSLGQNTGLENYAAGSVELSNSSDGTQYQYVLKSEGNTNEGESQFSSLYDDDGSEHSKRMYKCHVQGCGKQFQTSYRLKSHARTHSEDGYPCLMDTCRKSFNSSGDLQKHVKTHTGYKNFICDFEGCGKEYTTAHHLKVHKRAHSGERPFSCIWEGCGKMFSTGYGLKSHYRTHTNERPYRCHNCTKSFKTSGDLQKHVRTHTGERPFACTFKDCKRTFTTSNIRKVHLRTHTGERPYKCEVEGCGRSFASATNYKNHCRIHTGERPYVCEVPGCLKKFTEYSSLYKHNIVHTHQKPYTCNICHKTYRQTSTLAMHRKTVHGTETDDIFDENGDPISQLRKSGGAISLSPGDPVSSTYLHGMQLVLNGSSVDSAYNDIATQTHSNESANAIAIPIQVTVNADGTIAGTQGLNLTDASGRLIPVNLSVSIPMSSLSQMSDTRNQPMETENNSSNAIGLSNQPPTMIDSLTINNPLSGASDVINERISTPEPHSSAAASEDGEIHDRMTQQNLQAENIAEQVLVSSVRSEMQMHQSLSRPSTPATNEHSESRDDMTNVNLESYQAKEEIDDEGDVTERYLTSHYIKDSKLVSLES